MFIFITNQTTQHPASREAGGSGKGGMMERQFEIVWNGAGWYGPLSEREGAWGEEVIRYYRVNTDAGKNDPFQAGRDAYGQVGTPDWYDSEEEFYQ